MYAYHLIYDIPTANPRQYRVLVAWKNVYGSRFGGNPTTPTVLNGSGQLVIPGGSVVAPDVITAGRIEFFEETGIDLRQDAVRRQMQTVGNSWSRVLDGQSGAHCVYQEVQDAEFVERACNANIQGQVPRDQELYSAVTYDASVVGQLFGAISQTDLTTGWRGIQYNNLDSNNQALARRKSQAAGDWYVTAVQGLRYAP
ncbi:hypothetical protein B4N89_45265 [Embleya scabrispora]|uniref:Nudix hydrolase domain-containing protein n=1 Tax=Embleya scabrispora TaxID=159449 RepID=A0A1T3NIN8_9ACTN|nr:hypothetical protein [Embleya scabrispora]OPC76699.1 hypothetical protein B4N89_45265 [Embleya scabrispora]